MATQEKVILLKLDVNTDSYTKNVTSAKIQVAQLKAENDKLKETLQNAGDIGSASYKKAAAALTENEAALRAARGELKNYEKQLDTVNKANAAQDNSYEQLLRRYNDAEVKLKTLKGTIKQNADGTIELTKEYKAQQQEVLKLKEGLLAFNEGIKDGRLNVGNYAEGFKSALSQVSIFQGAVSQISSVVTQTSAGFQAARQGFNTISEGLSVSVEAGKSFTAAAGNWVSSAISVGNATEETAKKAIEAADATDAVAAASKTAGEVTSVATNKGANGWKIFRTALVSTGIGAIVVVIGALLGYLSQFQAGMDLLKGVTAAVGAVMEVLVGTLVKIGGAIVNFFLNPLDSIKNFSFSNMIDGFTNTGKAIGEAAKNAYDLEKAKQKLEDREISLIQKQAQLAMDAEDYRKIAEDKTKSDQARIDALKQAGEIEKQILKNNLVTEQQRLAILQKTIDEQKKNSDVKREDLKALEEQKVKVFRILDDIQDKNRDIAIESSKLQNKLNQDSINLAVGVNANKLKLAQQAGKDTRALEKEIAKQNYDAFVADTQKSDAEKKLALDNLNTELLLIDGRYNKEKSEKNKKAAEDRAKLQQQYNDIQNNLILDGKTREIAIETEAARLKLEAIKGNSKLEQDLRKSIAEQSALKILEIEKQYALKTQEEKQKIIDQNAAINKKAIDDETNNRLTALQIRQQEEIIAAQKRGATNAEIAALEEQQQKDYATQSLLIEQQRLNDTLNLELQAAQSRINNDNQFYAEREAATKAKLDSGKITQEEYNNEIKKLNDERAKTELETEQANQQAIEPIVKAIADNKVAITTTANQQIIDSEKKTAELRKAIQQQSFDVAVQGFAAIKALLARDEESKKKNIEVIKALGAAEVLLNGYKEISGYWAGAGKTTSNLGIQTAPFNAALATAQTIMASIRIGTALAQINKYADGGLTLGEANDQYNPSYKSKFSGGVVLRPTLWASNGQMNLAGEAGAEYVAPNWQLKQNPSLFRALETWRRTGVKPFADGGYTISQLSQPLLNSSVMFEQAIAKGFESAPAPVVSVQELANVQNRVNVIEARGNL